MGAGSDEKSSDEEMSEDEYDSGDDAMAGPVDPQPLLFSAYAYAQLYIMFYLLFKSTMTQDPKNGRKK